MGFAVVPAYDSLPGLGPHLQNSGLVLKPTEDRAVAQTSQFGVESRRKVLLHRYRLAKRLRVVDRRSAEPFLSVVRKVSNPYVFLYESLFGSVPGLGSSQTGTESLSAHMTPFVVSRTSNTDNGLWLGKWLVRDNVCPGESPG
jgi:hypothetical protein